MAGGSSRRCLRHLISGKLRGNASVTQQAVDAVRNHESVIAATTGLAAGHGHRSGLPSPRTVDRAGPCQVRTVASTADRDDLTAFCADPFGSMPQVTSAPL